MMKLAVLASSIAASSAFTSAPLAAVRTALHATEEATVVEESVDLGRSLDEVSGFGSSDEATADEPAVPAVAPINGWWVTFLSLHHLSKCPIDISPLIEFFQGAR